MEHIDESSPLYFYRNKQNECTAGIAEINRRIYGVSIARVVLALFFIAWLIWSWDWCTATVVWIIVAVTVVAFLYLIKVHGRLFAKKAYLEAVLDICRKEVRLSRHDFTGKIMAGQADLFPANIENRLQIRFLCKQATMYLNQI